MDMGFVEPQLSGAFVLLPPAVLLLFSVRLSLDVHMQTDWTCWAKSLKAAAQHQVVLAAYAVGAMLGVVTIFCSATYVCCRNGLGLR